MASGSITSHGPSRESYTPARKARGAGAETAGVPPRTRRCLLKGCERRFRPGRRASAIAAKPAGRRRGNGRVEGPAELPGHGGGQTEAERAKPALPGARQRAETTRERSSSGIARVITRNFFRWLLRPARLLQGFVRGVGRHCNGSVRTRAGVPWNAFGSASGAGARRARREGGPLDRRP